MLVPLPEGDNNLDFEGFIPDMELRKAGDHDVEGICRMVKDAVRVMDENGIHQWDEVYPAKEDFLGDIKDGNLFVGIKDGEIAVVFVLNRWQDEAYFSADWSYRGENFCVIHRLCVNPKFQKQGIAKKTLYYIEEKLKADGIESIRLDVFSQNPYALRLYEKAGYRKAGTADWRKGRFFLMEKNLCRERRN